MCVIIIYVWVGSRIYVGAKVVIILRPMAMCIYRYEFVDIEIVNLVRAPRLKLQIVNRKETKKITRIYTYVYLFLCV